ncbi:hypothetical protein DFA_07544 [Cavenderia fasciculata]|uniref:SAM domain-containing protein n=1 Tax=Cavenderia fasciculata TaxID=261658 RepID=F4PWQ6_CACFS|nr:uncharacterized protein DFA_07544 [Cavenderia fasciculata]EGG20420.1 hypothetical protein DFA_07544 [Cavenderia fasciculata]|eukprot:XP_004367403.1 hypothetical protein DFA_07544 [Cavenderia fasciculata]
MSEVKLYFDADNLNNISTLKQCPALYQPLNKPANHQGEADDTPTVQNGATYDPPYSLHFTHAMNYYATFKVKRLNIERTREDLVNPEDGGSVSLDWFEFGEFKEDTPIVVYIHSLTGGSHEPWLRSFAKHAYDTKGWRSVAFNNRGCCGNKITADIGYCGTKIDDFQMCIKHIQQKYPNAKLMLVGFSLGSVILVNYLKATGESSPFIASVSISNPINMTESCKTIESTYLNRKMICGPLADNIKRLFLKFGDRLNQYTTKEDIIKAQTVTDLDWCVTHKMFNYDSPQHYYEAASPSNHIQDIKKPILFINASDDSIAPVHAIPFAKFKSNPNTMLALTKRGGHLGFIDHKDWNPYSQKIGVEYLAAQLNNNIAHRKWINGKRLVESQVGDCYWYVDTVTIWMLGGLNLSGIKTSVYTSEAVVCIVKVGGESTQSVTSLPILTKWIWLYMNRHMIQRENPCFLLSYDISFNHNTYNAKTITEIASQSDFKRWSAKQVFEWATKEVQVREEYAQMLLDNDVDGESIAVFTEADFGKCGIVVAPAKKLYLAAQQLLIKQQQQQQSHQHSSSRVGTMADIFSRAYTIIDLSGYPNKEMCKDSVDEKQASRIVYEYGDSKDIDKVNQYLQKQFQEAQPPTNQVCSHITGPSLASLLLVNPSPTIPKYQPITLISLDTQNLYLLYCTNSIVVFYLFLSIYLIRTSNEVDNELTTFWQQLATKDIIEDMIKLENNTKFPVSSGNSLYVRRCYYDLFESLMIGTDLRKVRKVHTASWRNSRDRKVDVCFLPPPSTCQEKR